MIKRILPQPLQGRISAIPSKSHAHRLLICAALGDKPSYLELGATSIDIETTKSLLTSLGAQIQEEGDICKVTPIIDTPSNLSLQFNESGSSLRLILPILACFNQQSTLYGKGRLPERPIQPLTQVLIDHGAKIQRNWPMEVQGPISAGVFSLPGDISSQFISGLLLAAPLLDEDVTITLTSPLESEPYVQMTLDAMADFGVQVEKRPESYYIPASMHYQTPDHILKVEGDWSSAAFFLAAGALKGPITIDGLSLTSSQGDRAILDLLKDFGAEISVSPDSISVQEGQRQAFSASMKDIPDLLPILSVIASAALGESHLKDAFRLRLKESDRLQSTSAFLKALGGYVREEEDGLIIQGGQALHGGQVHSANDHRIAMSATIAASHLSDGPVSIIEAEAVAKSYPSFYEDFIALGGICHEL